MQKQFRGGQPYKGKLELKVHPDGIVSGKYRSDSIRPDPMYGKIENVMGGVSGANVHFSIGMYGIRSDLGEKLV